MWCRTLRKNRICTGVECCRSEYSAAVRSASDKTRNPGVSAAMGRGLTLLDRAKLFCKVLIGRGGCHLLERRLPASEVLEPLVDLLGCGQRGFSL